MKIVWLHGYGFDHQIWKNLLICMPGHEHVCPDFAGFGTQKLASLPDSMKEMAEWLNARIEHSGAEPFLIIGHSMGGYVALEYLNRFQNNSCKGLVLLHSHCYSDSRDKIAERMKQASFIRQRGSLPFLKHFYPSVFANKAIPSSFLHLQSAYESSIKKETLAKYQEIMAYRTDHSTTLEALQIPLLLVQGLFDQLIPTQYFEQMLSLSRHSTELILQQTGHMGMIEEPDFLAKALNTFINSLQALE